MREESPVLRLEMLHDICPRRAFHNTTLRSKTVSRSSVQGLSRTQLGVNARGNCHVPRVLTWSRLHKKKLGGPDKSRMSNDAGGSGRILAELTKG